MANKKNTDENKIKNKKTNKTKNVNNNSKKNAVNYEKENVVEKESTIDKKSFKKDSRKLKKELRRERRLMSSKELIDPDVKNRIILVCIIAVIFCAFYFLTVFITKDNSKNNSKKSSDTKKISATISYDEIILGRSFSMGDGEYLVLYYDESNKDINNEMSSLANTYKNSSDHLTIYIVNMNSPFNSKYSSTSSNTNPSNASEMKINGPTLIKFGNNKVEEYIEGSEDISNYLS